MKFRIVCLILALLLVLPMGGFALQAESVPFEMKSKAALLMDQATGSVLLEQNAHEKRPMASITKVMTLLLVMEALDSEKISLDDLVRPSQKAQSMGGSQAFIDSSYEYTVSELIKSIVVASANDSCVALAEALCGSAESFVEVMNSRAEQLGMRDTNFVNCTGLPAEGHCSTAYDIALMMRELLKHGQYYQYSGVWMYEMDHGGKRTTQLSNTNKLLRSYEGCDGGKTGYTDEAGYCMTVTAKRGESRFIAVILGAPSSAVRFEEASQLLNCGFAEYETRILYEADSKVESDIPVKGGDQPTVNGVAKQRIAVTLRKGNQNDLHTEIRFTPDLAAPIACRDPVGSMLIYVDGDLAAESDLLADAEVNKARFGQLFRHLLQVFFPGQAKPSS